MLAIRRDRFAGRFGNRSDPNLRQSLAQMRGIAGSLLGQQSPLKRGQSPKIGVGRHRDLPAIGEPLPDRLLGLGDLLRVSVSGFVSGPGDADRERDRDRSL